MLLDSGNLLTLAGAGLALWIISVVVNRILHERKIERLGGHAPIYKSKLPLHLDFMYKGVVYAAADVNLKFWHHFFSDAGTTNSPYTIEAFPGGKRIVFTADPENIKAVLASQFNDYGKGSHLNMVFHDFLGDGIFSTDGKLWQDSRQLIRPQFIKDRVSDLVIFERHCQSLIPKLGGNGQAVDLRDLFFRFTLDAATEFLLGHNVDSMHDTHSQFGEAFAAIQTTQSLIFRVGPFWPLVPKREFRKNLKILNDFVVPFVDRALALTPDELAKRTKTEEGYTFLHAIAAYTRDPKVLRDQVVNVLLAGRDTTACTLQWMFFELGRQPQIVEELRREIADTVGWDRPPTYADLKSMKLVQYTMNETLRLYPVVPYNVRVALKDTTLPRGGGPEGLDPIGVPKDTAIGYSTQYMQLTPDIYPPVSEKFPPPQEFAPRRWEHWQPRPWTYIPFNGGPRICVGQQFALTEMSYTLVRILQQFSRVETVSAAVGNEGAAAAADAAAAKEAHGLDGGFKGQGGAPSMASESGERKKDTRSVRLLPWARNEAKVSLAELQSQRTLPMRSDIVLMPGEEVLVRFFE